MSQTVDTLMDTLLDIKLGKATLDDFYSQIKGGSEPDKITGIDHNNENYSEALSNAFGNPVFGSGLDFGKDVGTFIAAYVRGHYTVTKSTETFEILYNSHTKAGLTHILSKLSKDTGIVKHAQLNNRHWLVMMTAYIYYLKNTYSNQERILQNLILDIDRGIEKKVQELFNMDVSQLADFINKIGGLSFNDYMAFAGYRCLQSRDTKEHESASSIMGKDVTLEELYERHALELFTLYTIQNKNLGNI